jgi:hypothetical protein
MENFVPIYSRKVQNVAKWSQMLLKNLKLFKIDLNVFFFKWSKLSQNGPICSFLGQIVKNLAIQSIGLFFFSEQS